MNTRIDVQTVEIAARWWVALAIILAVAYQSLWYIAPGLLAQPLWPGSALSIAFVLGMLSLLAPILIAWLLIRHDASSGEAEKYETFGH
jgi:hypothetical protein